MVAREREGGVICSACATRQHHLCAEGDCTCPQCGKRLGMGAWVVAVSQGFLIVGGIAAIAYGLVRVLEVAVGQ